MIYFRIIGVFKMDQVKNRDVTNIAVMVPAYDVKEHVWGCKQGDFRRSYQDVRTILFNGELNCDECADDDSHDCLRLLLRTLSNYVSFFKSIKSVIACKN